MKRNPNYVLRELAGVPYLLPYGQSIASHDRGVMLNETGVFLWDLLENDRTMEELITLCADHYGLSDDEIAELSCDLRPFLDDLVKSGAIQNELDPFAYLAPFYKAVSIAELKLRLGGPSEVFSPLFDAFAIPEPAHYDMSITACAGVCPFQKPGHAILRNSMMSVIDCEDYFEIQFHANQQVKECLIKRDGSRATLYYRLPLSETLTEEIFHGIREAFLYLAGLSGMVALHSTSILYRGKAWLFSGHSGMGKSTHARLWKDSFGTPILNGDLNLLAMRGLTPVIYGIPWCGTSKISDVSTHPLGGIALLARAPKNFITELSPDHRILLVDQRLISHSWTPSLFDRNLEVIKKIAPEILICKLNCTKDPEAAAIMRERIDRFLA